MRDLSPSQTLVCWLMINDMLEMVKHLASHTEAAGHVYVGTIQVKKLQAIFYWVHDHQKHWQVIDHNDLDEDVA